LGDSQRNFHGNAIPHLWDSQKILTHEGVLYRFIKPVAVSEITLVLMRVVGPQEITKMILPSLGRVLFRFQRNLYPTIVGSATL
jgi:hypothetical protein